MEEGAFESYTREGQQEEWSVMKRKEKSEKLPCTIPDRGQELSSHEENDCKKILEQRVCKKL